MHPIQLTVLLLVIAVTCGQAFREPKEYLSIKRSSIRKEISFVVKRIESGDWGKDLETLTKNLEVVRNVTLKVKLDGTIPEELETLKLKSFGKKDFYWLSTVVADLYDLYSDESSGVACHNLQARTFIRVVEHKFGSLQKYLKSLGSPPKGILAEYLRTYGHQHLKQCLSIIEEDFEKYAKNLSRLEMKLDTLVAMGKEYPSGSEDANRLAAAEALDLAKGKYDAKRMLEAVRPIIESEERGPWHRRPADPGALLEEYIDITCRVFRTSFQQVDTYNLARVIVPQAAAQQVMPLRFKKLNEYSRLCIPFADYTTDRSARANVLRNMKRHRT